MSKSLKINEHNIKSVCELLLNICSQLLIVARNQNEQLFYKSNI